MGQPFWGYASILFDFLLVMIIPLGFAIRELVLLRRQDCSGEERRDPG